MTLSLPTARKCKAIQVQLVSKQNVYLKGRYETHEFINKTIELDTGSQTLGPGDHRCVLLLQSPSDHILSHWPYRRFAFSFVVPADTAPYERCAYGRVYQRLVATAFGVGKLGANITAQDEVTFITNQSVDLRSCLRHGSPCLPARTAMAFHRVSI